MQGGRRAEQQTSERRSADPPFSENDGSDGEIAGATGHALGEGVDVADRKERAGQRRHEARKQHTAVADTRHRQAGLVDSLRLSARGMDREPDRGVTQHERGDRDQCDPGIEQPHLLEHGIPDHRNVAEQRRLHLGEPGNFGARPRAKDLAIGKRGGAEHQNVDADAGHDLVGAQRVAEERLQQRNRDHGDDADQKADERIAGCPGANGGGKGRHQHHALDAHVQHTGALGHHFADAGEQERRRQPDRGAEEDSEQFPGHCRSHFSMNSAAPASVMTISPWMTATSAVGTAATISMLMPPERMKPNSSEAAITPGIEPRDSRPATRPSKP